MTFSNGSNNPTTTARTITVQAQDSGASPTTTSNTINETVDIDLPAPTITASGLTSTKTAGGPAVVVDAGVTVNSYDTSHITGATMTITNVQSGDTLNFSTQNGITGTYNSGTGVLQLNGTATVAQYNTALQSITYSNTTNSSTTTRTLTVSATDSNASPTTGATTAESVNVVAPLKVTGIYISGSAWNTSFLSYLGSHGQGSSSFGFNIADGSTQLSDLPWFNLNTIIVTFSGTPSQINKSSLEVLSGSGNTVLSTASTTFTQINATTYKWVLPAVLTNSRELVAVASSTSSFGTPVLDANGAGLDGQFSTGGTLPSGSNGLAGGAFSAFYNVFPGDINRDTNDNGTDLNLMRPLAINTRDTTGSYISFYDVNGDGTINGTDLSDIRPDTGRLATGSPTAPAATQVGGLDSGTALGVIETTSSTPSSGSSANNTGGSVAAAPASSSSSSSTSSLGSDDDDDSSSLASTDATDEAVGSFDLADLWV